MPTVSFRRTQNSEILAQMVQNPCRGPSNRLYAVVIGGDAVHKIQSVRSLTFHQPYWAALLEIFGGRPVSPLLFQLAIGISTALQRLQRLLQRLRHVAVVHQPAPQVKIGRASCRERV